jgi:hypothetical protein
MASRDALYRKHVAARNQREPEQAGTLAGAMSFSPLCNVKSQMLFDFQSDLPTVASDAIGIES